MMAGPVSIPNPRAPHRAASSLWLLVALSSALGTSPLAADCTCTVSVSAAEPTWTSKSTSTGTCNKTTALLLFRDEFQVGFKDCGITTSCSSETTRSTTCLRTGVHAVRLECGCGKAGTDVHGNPICAFDSGDAETSFSVNTTPVVSVTATGPDVTGKVDASAPYSFPNTPSSGDRDLELFVDGDFRVTQGGELLAGSWDFTLGTDCWKQGPHEITIKAIACHATDPLFKAQATTTIEVDHEPQVTLDVTPATGDGFTAQVNYSYPQTQFSTQRFLRLEAFPSGALFANFQPGREGEFSKLIPCNQGQNHRLVLSAHACTDVKLEQVVELEGCPAPPKVHGCQDQEARCEDCTGPPAEGFGGAGGPGSGGGGVPVGGGG
ncbi:MAG: hypothetical protein ACRDKW_08910, partial [Actinomycetota bacterium]